MSRGWTSWNQCRSHHVGFVLLYFFISSRFLTKCSSTRTTDLLSVTLTTTSWTSRRSRPHTSCLHPSWWMLTGILTLLTTSAWCQEEKTARRSSSYPSWDTWLTVKPAPSLLGLSRMFALIWNIRKHSFYPLTHARIALLLLRWWRVGWAGTWPTDSRKQRKLIGQSHQTVAEWAGRASQRRPAGWRGRGYVWIYIMSVHINDYYLKLYLEKNLRFIVKEWAWTLLR